MQKVKELFDKFSSDMDEVHSEHSASIDELAQTLIKRSIEQKEQKFA